MDTETLRHAALVHGSIPPDTGLRETRSPLMRLIPNEVRPSPETWALAEQVTGKPIPMPSGAMAPYVWTARLRAALNRWAIQQVGVMAAREDVRAREMWKVVTR